MSGDTKWYNEQEAKLKACSAKAKIIWVRLYNSLNLPPLIIDGINTIPSPASFIESHANDSNMSWYQKVINNARRATFLSPSYNLNDYYSRLSRPDNLKRFNALRQELSNLKYDSSIQVTADVIVDAFEHNYNLLKGETPNSELNKWLEFLNKHLGIEYHYAIQSHVYYFRKKTANNNYLIYSKHASIRDAVTKIMFAATDHSIKQPSILVNGEYIIGEKVKTFIDKEGERYQKAINEQTWNKFYNL